MAMNELIHLLAREMSDRARDLHVLVPVKLSSKPRKWNIARDEVRGEVRVQRVVQGGSYTEPLLVGATVSGRLVQDRSTENGMIGLKQLRRAHQMAFVRPRVPSLPRVGHPMELELLTPDGWRQLRIHKIHSIDVRDTLWATSGTGYNNNHVAQWIMDEEFKRKTAVLGIEWRFSEDDLTDAAAAFGVAHEELPLVCTLASESYGLLAGMASLTLRARKLCVVDLDGKEPLPARMAELEPGVDRDKLAARLPPATCRNCAVLVYDVHATPRMPGFLMDCEHYWRADVCEPTWPVVEPIPVADHANVTSIPVRISDVEDAPFVQL